MQNVLNNGEEGSSVRHFRPLFFEADFGDGDCGSKFLSE